MASLRRSRTLPTDGAIARFLYTILKQLDLKSIDWQIVADQLDITNGHAARMRFSRFKQQMEGVPTTPRRARAAAPRPKKSKDNKPAKPSSSLPPGELATGEQPSVKPEPAEVTEQMEGVEPHIKDETMVKPEPIVKPEVVVKEEPKDEGEGVWSSPGGTGVGGLQQMSLEPESDVPQGFGDLGKVAGEVREASLEPPCVKPEPVVKIEPRWED